MTSTADVQKDKYGSSEWSWINLVMGRAKPGSLLLFSYQFCLYCVLYCCVIYDLVVFGLTLEN